MLRDTNKEIVSSLYVPFDNVDSRRGRGGTYDYIKWQHVADRMNKVFGVCWTSRIVSEHISTENVVLRVCVKIKDHNTGESFTQEGYGGADFRGGEDTGTAFKSAYSKGIKDACKKWGVGLFLSEESNSKPSSGQSYNTGNQSYNTSVPTQPASIPMGITASIPTSIPSVPTTISGAPQTQGLTNQIQPIPSTITNKTVPTNTNIPIPPVQAPVEQASVQQQQQPQANKPAAFQIPTPISGGASMGMSPPVSPIGVTTSGVPAQQQVDTQASYDAPSSITAVQLLAITNIAKPQGIETEEDILSTLINTEQSGIGKQVNKLDELSYNDAVKVIKMVKELQDRR